MAERCSHDIQEAVNHFLARQFAADSAFLGGIVRVRCLKVMETSRALSGPTSLVGGSTVHVLCTASGIKALRLSAA
jgi:hypothetical protein